MLRRSWLRSLLVVAIAILFGWSSASGSALALGGPMPPLNQPSPGFTLPTNMGDGNVSLSDYLGQWVVLYFYPKDFTPGCTLEAQRFQADLAKFQAKNTQILGVSADDIHSHAEFCDSEGLKFPLLADIKGDVSKAYGSWMGFISMRHTFIIDPQGVLRDRIVDVRPATHSQELLQRLDQLQHPPR